MVLRDRVIYFFEFLHFLIEYIFHNTLTVKLKKNHLFVSHHRDPQLHVGKNIYIYLIEIKHFAMFARIIQQKIDK